jgi:VanZ family protein
MTKNQVPACEKNRQAGKFNKRFLNWLIISYCCFIILVSVALVDTAVRLNKIHFLGIRSDHLLHVLLFIPWMLLVRWRWPERKNVAVFCLALAAGLLMTGISEGLQLFIPYRSCSFLDMLADSTGLGIGAAAFLMRRKTNTQ